MDRTKRLAMVLFVVGILLIMSGVATLVVFGRDATSTVNVLQDASTNTIPLPPTLSGTIVNESGPVAGAIVQLQATDNKTQSDSNGKFTLTGISGTKPVVVTAW